VFGVPVHLGAGAASWIRARVRSDDLHLLLERSRVLLGLATHYGLVAAANVTTKLEVARRCLPNLGLDDVPQVPHPETPPSWRDLVFALTGIDLLVCPVCGGRSMERRALRDGAEGSRPHDTS
jgi:hypothetical protein